MPSDKKIQDLTVKGESIERIYSYYTQQRLSVNRRYQRKLIWTLDEKRQFIDSIILGYPVPIILLAENKSATSSDFEIIDGMQRLNAVISFIENEYKVGEKYFDLNTMAITKAMLDSEKLTQKSPMLDRDTCVRIASYLLPLSIYEFSVSSDVDQVFRRINSGGRQLSRHELRTAGATGHFATAVRTLATKVRGDVSGSEVLKLNEMKKISITNRDLEYGLDVDEIFWVLQGILTKDQVRESRDEELIADMLAYMALDEAVASRSEFLDDFFGMYRDDPGNSRFDSVEQAVQKRTVPLIVNDFTRVLDEIKLTLSHSGQTFGQLLFGKQPPRAPRYFQAVFLAFYDMIIREQLAVKDRAALVKRMTGSGGKISIPEGGAWPGESRQATAQATAGMYRRCFAKSTNTDPATVHWITQLENILTQSYTEQNNYDFKQGFLKLDKSKKFDDQSFEKILKTCAGIANISKNARGYVLVGIADSARDAKRVHEMFGADSRLYQNFHVTGVEHEAIQLGKTADQYFQLILSKLQLSPLSDDLRAYMQTNLKSVRYYDKTVFVFDVAGQEDASTYDGEYYERSGNSLSLVTKARLAAFLKRYLLGR